MRIIKDSIKNIRVFDKEENKDIKDFFESGITSESEKRAIKATTPVVEFEADVTNYAGDTIRHYKIRIFMLIKQYENNGKWNWRHEYYQQAILENGEHFSPESFVSGYSTESFEIENLKKITKSMKQLRTKEITLDGLCSLPLFHVFIE